LAELERAREVRPKTCEERRSSQVLGKDKPVLTGLSFPEFEQRLSQPLEQFSAVRLFSPPIQVCKAAKSRSSQVTEAALSFG